MSQYGIRVVDLETSGRPEDATEDFTPEVVELAYTDLVLIVDGDGKRAEVGETQSWRFGVSEPMLPSVMAVHHIRNEDVEGLPLASDEILRDLLTRDTLAVPAGPPLYMAAHKADFERHFLSDEVCGQALWLDTYKAAKHLTAGPYGNQVLKYALGFGHLPHDRCMPPHAAGPDSYVTAHILGWMLQQTTGAQIELWTREPEYHPLCPIGAKQGWQGKPWNVIDHGFLTWMLQQPSMEADLKHAARTELEARRQRQMAHMISTEKD